MSKIHNRIISLQVGRWLRRIIIMLVCVVIIGGGFSAYMMRNQIADVVTAEHMSEQHENMYVDQHEKDNKHEFDMEDAWKASLFTTTPASAIAVVFVTAILVIILGILYWIFAAVWLEKQAIDSGMNGLLWLLAGFVGNVAAMIVFAIVRNLFRVRCDQCGKWQKKATFCINCGSSLDAICPECGQICAKTDIYCKGCGRRMKDAEK